MPPFAAMFAFFLLFIAIGLLFALAPQRVNKVLNEFKVPVSFTRRGESTPAVVRALGIMFAVVGAGFLGVLVWHVTIFGDKYLR